MFNLGAPEIVVILVVALLILGPKRLPELARGIGRFMREFRRQTDEVRTVVEREFYKMDQELESSAPPAETVPAEGTGALADPEGTPSAAAAVPESVSVHGPSTSLGPNGQEAVHPELVEGERRERLPESSPGAEPAPAPVEDSTKANLH